MHILDHVAVVRLQQVPRHTDDAKPDPSSSQIFAALAAAHAELRTRSEAALLFAWYRPKLGGPVQILLGGRPWCPALSDGPSAMELGQVPVAYPPGARGTRVDADVLGRAWRDLPAWVRCTGTVDPLWTSQAEEATSAPRRGGFDDYVAHLRTPFVWLIIARPVDVTTVREELADLEAAFPGLRQRENSAQAQIDLARTQTRYRELSRALAAGVWDVEVLVGADTPTKAHRAAALLCSASDLDDLPYLLAPGDKATDLTTASRPTDTTLVSDRGQQPGLRAAAAVVRASGEFLAAIARPPRRELPGIRLVERAEFDLTPDHHGDDSNTVMLGSILDDADEEAGEFTVSTATLNRHVLTTGATGSGKSQTTRHLLEQLHHQQVPWLVIEPAKTEYIGMAGRIGADQVVVLHPGDPDAVPYGLNPLHPEPGFPLQTHIDLLRALFLAAFEADEPFPQVLSQALDRCYRDLGWDPTISASRLSGITPRYPRLADLHRTALEVVEGIGYGKEVSDNVRGFVDVRLRSLRLGTPGRFFDGHYPISISDLLRRNVVLEIEDVGEDGDKAFLMGALLIRIVEHLRVRHTMEPTVGLRHVTVIEEAHRLLRRATPGSPTAHAVELFTALLAEIRAYGEGIVVAEQIPDKIVPDVIKNTALKIVHRLPGQDDRDAVGATMNLDPAQSRHVVSLPPGRAAVFADGMDRPIRITVPYGEPRETRPAGPVPQIAVDRASAGPLLTARQLAETERLAEDPELVLWIELLTVAHLTGRPSPNPSRDWCMALMSRASHEIISHAILHQINDAIDARYTSLTYYFQPEELATHLAGIALRALDGGISVCDGSEVEWQAGRYRWVDVLRALSAYEGDGQHPDTDQWAERGLYLTSATVVEQLEQLEAHPDSWRPGTTIITGGIPSRYELAVAQLSSAGDDEARLVEATWFLDLATTWPLAVITEPRKI